jgi:hypothetical protein
MTYAHADEVAGAVRAAERIVPLILDIVGPIRSVADLGGGTGAWLARFVKHGVADVTLVDQPEVASGLLIDAANFRPANLNEAFPPPPRCDLAVSVECAEHLQPHRAPHLVKWLTDAADRVVFSAAIPGQGGKGHINEQVPSYWTAMFRDRGFVRRDVLRPRIIADAQIPWWYRQNLVIYTKPEVVLNAAADDFLPEEFVLAREPVLHALQQPGFTTLVRRLGPAFAAALRNRSGK